MSAAGAVLVVKPADVAEAARAAADAGAERVLSVAAGITTARHRGGAGSAAAGRARDAEHAGADRCGGGRDQPGLVRRARTICAWAEEILGAVGVVMRVPEKALDAVTGLSGSGPAYVFLVAEAMAEAGVLAGLPRDVAETLAFQTLLGSARLLVDSDDGPAALRAAVTSPGGTTAAGLRELERHGVRAAFLDAVMAAAERSRELGA